MPPQQRWVGGYGALLDPFYGPLGLSAEAVIAAVNLDFARSNSRLVADAGVGDMTQELANKYNDVVETATAQIDISTLTIAILCPVAVILWDRVQRSRGIDRRAEQQSSRQNSICMSSIPIPDDLPPLVRLDQTFPRLVIDNACAATNAALLPHADLIKPQQSVAIGVGSRGIDRIRDVVQSIVAWVRARGADPFIVPAMGSHGGATAEGQRAVLASYGVTEQNVGAPVRSSMETIRLPQGDLSVPTFVDRNAQSADATIIVNRIKVHTDYHGPYESGLMKMIAIGLGKRDQPTVLHERGIAGLRDLMPQVARHKIQHTNVVLGVGLVENAYDELCRIEAIPSADIADAEPALLDFQRTCMPTLPVDEIDILLVDRIGKDISGTGLDTNIIGRMFVPGQPEPATPHAKMLVVHSLTEATHGNALGIGLADVTTRAVTDQIDWDATYMNLYTATFLARGKMPIAAANDGEALAFAIRGARGCGATHDNGRLRIVRIRDTLSLASVYVSPAIVDNLRDPSQVRVNNKPCPILDGERLAVVKY